MHANPGRVLDLTGSNRVMQRCSQECGSAGSSRHTGTHRTEPAEHGVNVSRSHRLKKNILGSFSHGKPQTGSTLRLSSWLDIGPEPLEWVSRNSHIAPPWKQPQKSFCRRCLCKSLTLEWPNESLATLLGSAAAAVGWLASRLQVQKWEHPHWARGAQWNTSTQITCDC